MALDLDAVAVGLMNAVKDAELTLNGHRIASTDVLTDAVTPPHFAVAEFVTNYHRTFDAGPGAKGLDQVTVTCRLFTSRADDATGQKTARKAASMTGANSIPAALEAARGAPGELALGGAAADLVVQTVRGPRVYDIGAQSYYGLEFSVFVIG